MRLNVLLGVNHRLFYREQATVLRVENIRQENGSTKQELRIVADLVDIPCRISMNTQDDNLDQQDDQNPILEVGTLFCDPKWPLKAADVLEVTRNGETLRWIAGVPARYQHSQQVRVVRRGRG